MIQMDLGSKPKPGVDLVKQAIHPSALSKLVAISILWVTTVEGCEGKNLQLCDDWQGAHATNSANHRTLVSCVRTGVFEVA
jgi:hypothetical protein